MKPTFFGLTAVVCSSFVLLLLHRCQDVFGQKLDDFSLRFPLDESKWTIYGDASYKKSSSYVELVNGSYSYGVIHSKKTLPNELLLLPESSWQCEVLLEADKLPSDCQLSDFIAVLFAKNGSFLDYLTGNSHGSPDETQFFGAMVELLMFPADKHSLPGLHAYGISNKRKRLHPKPSHIPDCHFSSLIRVILTKRNNLLKIRVNDCQESALDLSDLLPPSAGGHQLLHVGVAASTSHALHRRLLQLQLKPE